MSKYTALFKIRFLTSIQYRAAALAGVATQFAWGFMSIIAFSAFYRSDPSAFPMGLSQTTSYIWLQQALLALFMTWFYDADIFNTITSGSIAYELVRPMNLYSRWFCQSAATRTSKAALRSLPILAVAFFLPAPYRLLPPASFTQFCLFLPSVALALGVVIAFSMIVYITTFFTMSPLGIRIIAVVLADFFAGAVIPLPFFPDGFQQATELLPFASMQNMPLRIYIGDIAGSDALVGIALQMFWVSALILLGKLLMNRALSRVIVQGG